MPNTTFRESWWSRQGILNVLNFHYPNSIDHIHGGYISQLDSENGYIYDGQSKHLVSTCRLIYNFSIGELIEGPDWCCSAAKHGLQFLWDHHFDHEQEGFNWLLQGTEPVERDRYCYGHVFVMLACATAMKANIVNSDQYLKSISEILTEHFWEPDHGLFRIKLGPNWESTSSYRGQNANMHACEALLAAYEATNEAIYLKRAYLIAESLVKELVDENNGLLWEHYTKDWEIDRDYNKDDLNHQFRPWGYQPGHHVEWAKLLVMLDRHHDADWFLDRATSLFKVAIEHGWDDVHGGFFYTFDLDGEPVVTEKYTWAIAEAIGASALLARRTEDDWYWKWYDKLWDYAQEYAINSKYGNWYPSLTRENEYHPKEDDRSPTIEPGYHPINNCYEALRCHLNSQIK